MRVLLINPPPYKIQEAYYDTPPYPRTALSFLAGFLRHAGVDTYVLDCKYDKLGYDEAIKKIFEIKPDIIGYTSFTNEIIQAGVLAEKVKDKDKNITNIIGGVHIGTLPEQTLREFPQFDFGVVGEGENTLLELYQCLLEKGDPKKIPGVCLIENDNYFYGGERTRIMDLDKLPPPAWDLFKPSQEYILHTSRGCPFHCPFCVNPNGRRVRASSAQLVLDEVEALVNRYGSLKILFGDEIFTLDRTRTVEICEGLIARGLHKKVKWWCITHVRFIDKELAVLMKSAGCIKIGLGIESGNEDRLKEINKGTTIEMILETVQELKEAKIVFEAFFILGQPDETYETALELINFAVKLNPTLPVFGIMVPYPGTKIWKMAKNSEGGYHLQTKDWNAYNKQLGDALSFKNVSRQTLERLQIWGYIKVFVWNFRFFDLTKYVWEYRKIGLSIFFKVIKQYFTRAEKI